MSACPALSVAPLAAVLPHVRVRRLAALDGEQIAAHLGALDAEAQVALFAAPLSAQAIAAYVDSLDYRRDLCIGAFSSQRVLVGLLHLRLAGRQAQLAASVAAGWRQQGVGRALLARGLRMGRALGVRQWQLAAHPAADLPTEPAAGSAIEVAMGSAMGAATEPADDSCTVPAAHLPLRRICDALGYPVEALR
ncbi:hypothetical protein VX159_07425 [Dechloromonas sp. ZY10]|uniref:hypothetical protein n=1 Tax=Dechloromonas aquae TaxID=2664436 RepID=UPI003526C612